MDKKADIVAFIVSENRINHFEIEQVNRTTSEHWKLLLLADSNKELIQKYLRLGSPCLKTNSKLVLMSPTCRLVVMLMSCSYFPGKVIIKVDLD